MFKVGDKVDWLGWQGTVEKVHDDSYDITVRDKCGFVRTFYKDGRYLKEQRPSLVLIERPKKKIKKTITKWVNIYPDGCETYYYTKDRADMCSNPNRIACVELTGEYEVEE